jgi:hypothetical protein
VRGTPEQELALPFTRPVSIPAHGLVRKLVPLIPWSVAAVALAKWNNL